MPRTARDDAPGVAHHVMARGIEGRAIFLDSADRTELVRRLECLLPALDFRCFAWVLMPNHFHLVVRSGRVRVSRLMARLGTGYACYFNHRHARSGHLFQNRFRSRLVHDDIDLLGLVLYVCRNPLDAGLVASADALERHAWSSTGALSGRRPPFEFEAVGDTLALFGDEPACARERFRSWLGARRDAGGPLPPLLPERPESSARRRPPRAPADCSELSREVCRRFEVSEAALRSRSRTPALASARRAFAREASRSLGLSGAEIARALCVTPAAVSRMLSRARPSASASQASQ